MANECIPVFQKKGLLFKPGAISMATDGTLVSQTIGVVRGCKYTVVFFNFQMFLKKK